MTMYSESLRAFLKPVLPYLDDPAVSEIMINGPEDIWIEKKGKVTRLDHVKFSDEGLLGAARNMAQFMGRPLNDEKPRLDARLPDGSRIHVVIAPIARKGTTISIRKFFKEKLTIDALIRFGSLTPPMARLIDAAIHTKLNMLVAGGTGSGKTTLLNIVSSLIPDDERILTIEDSAELQLNQSHVVPFESRPPDKFGKGGVDMGDLLHSALRLRPDRIVVGEVRGGEAFHLMQAMNTGHGGSLATTHANTPSDTLRRIESLCLMSGIELPMVAIRAQVASAINMIICCERYHDGSRKTTALSEVLPLNDKGDYRTQDIFVFTPVTKDEDGHILGYHAPTGIVPNFVARARAYGFSDLTPEYFDPRTYGVPPPPQFAVGTEFQTRWAPSLKHREAGQPDPAEYREEWQEFEHKLKREAKEAKGEAEKIQVQVPAAPASSPPSAAAEPAVRPRPPTSSGHPASTAQASPPRPAARPALPPARDDDKTPPPTRNPLQRPAPSALHAQSGTMDEPKVEISQDLLAEQDLAMSEREDEDTVGPRPSSMRPPMRSGPPGSNRMAPPPGGQVRRTLRPPEPEPQPSQLSEEALFDDDLGSPPSPGDADKTHIRPAPTQRRK